MLGRNRARVAPEKTLRACSHQQCSFRDLHCPGGYTQRCKLSIEMALRGYIQPLFEPLMMVRRRIFPPIERTYTYSFTHTLGQKVSCSWTSKCQGEASRSIRASNLASEDLNGITVVALCGWCGKKMKIESFLEMSNMPQRVACTWLGYYAVCLAHTSKQLCRGFV